MLVNIKNIKPSCVYDLYTESTELLALYCIPPYRKHGLSQIRFIGKDPSKQIIPLDRPNNPIYKRLQFIGKIKTPLTFSQHRWAYEKYFEKI